MATGNLSKGCNDDRILWEESDILSATWNSFSRMTDNFWSIIGQTRSHDVRHFRFLPENSDIHYKRREEAIMIWLRCLYKLHYSLINIKFNNLGHKEMQNCMSWPHLGAPLNGLKTENIHMNVHINIQINIYIKKLFWSTNWYFINIALCSKNTVGNKPTRFIKFETQGNLIQ